jgi:hypothetical protein
LTLRLDDELIGRAKEYSRETGRSLSQLVAAYFALLTEGVEPRSELTPTVRSLRGVLRGHDVDEEDYRRHLEDKHA